MKLDIKENSNCGSKKTILKVKGLTKAFSGRTVVNNVDLEVRPGEVVSLVGENGAGKSTIKNMLTGILEPTEGIIEIDGHKVCGFKSSDYGIAAVHQEFSLFGSLSVAENVCINNLPGKKVLIDWSDCQSTAYKYLKAIGASIDINAQVNYLSAGEQQLVEIAKALRQTSRLLILDEPTTSLTAPERQKLFSIVKKLKSQGLGIIFISHFIDEVYEISDYLIVLRDGCRVGGGTCDELPRNKLEELMVGRPVSERHVKVSSAGDEMALQVKGLTSDRFTNISLSVCKGEIVGIAGLMGAGRTELIEAIYGINSSTGEVWVEGKPVQKRTPLKMKQKGISFVPEDRKHHGLFANRPVRENISCAALKKFIKRSIPFLGFNKEKENATQIARNMHISCPGLESPIVVLSGGNQQKAILGRWLAINPKICIFDEPTRGVDIGAKEEIHKLIAGLACDGTAVLLVSSDLPELMQLSHRILVMKKGKIVGEFMRPNFDAKAIISKAATSSTIGEDYD